MTDLSTADLERQAEAARAQVADTAESLRNKITPGQMVDEFTGMLSEGDAGAALRNLKAQVRDNPLPLALVGAGLAWLMFGQGRSESSGKSRPGALYGENEYGAWDDEEELLPEGFADEDPASQVYGSRSSASVYDDEDHGDGSSLTGKISGAASSAMAMAGDALDTAKDTLSGAKHSAERAGQKIGKSASGARRALDRRSRSVGRRGAKMRDATQDLIQREPLVLAALGLAAGAAIGALLPHTAVEDETFGGYGRKLRDAGEDMIEKGIEEAKDVASEVYDATRKEADRQGLTPEGEGSLVDKVSNVVKAAAAKTEESVRDKTEGHG